MRSFAIVAVTFAAAACGDPPLPGQQTSLQTLTAGPVTIVIDPLAQSFTLTLASPTPLVTDHFLSVGKTDTVDPTHYYDPAGAEIALHVPEVTGFGISDVELAGGIKISLSSASALPNVAVLDIDATADPDPEMVLMRLGLPKGDEPIYGTGDAPITPDVAGTVREMQLRVDLTSASTLNETHVPVPVVLWPRRGAGMFIADDRPAAIDAGKTDPSSVTATFTQPGRGTYRVYLFTGEPLDLVRTYSHLSTLPAVPPRWAFAPQQWRNEWTDGAEMLGDASEMRARHIPGSVMWIDNPWQTAYNTFDVDTARFPQAQQMISSLADQGYRVVFWSTPYVDSGGLTKADHTEGTQLHHFVTDDAGSVIDYPWANGPGAMVDFTHDGASAWWGQRIKKVVDLGASASSSTTARSSSPTSADRFLRCGSRLATTRPCTRAMQRVITRHIATRCRSAMAS